MSEMTNSSPIQSKILQSNSIKLAVSVSVSSYPNISIMSVRPGYFDIQVTVFEEAKVAGGEGKKIKKIKNKKN